MSKKPRVEDREERRDFQVPKILLTYEEAAWSLGISKSKLYTMVSRGQIPVSAIGGNTLFRPKDLETLAEKNIIIKNR